MFLHSCPNVNSGADYEKITSNALNTYTLGEYVGREWGIAKVLKWRSMADPQTVAKGVDNSHLGLHKVLGTTVEAIVGGVYHQFVRFPTPSSAFLFALAPH
jgi:dsRNA-specific ribonuclease